MYFSSWINNIIGRGNKVTKRETGSNTVTSIRTGYTPASFCQTQPLALAAVYRCVNVLADAVSNLPMQYIRMQNDIFVEDRSSRLHYLLNVQPSENMNAVDFWAQVVRYMLLNGNAYIVPVYSATVMGVDRLVLVNPTAVAHDTLNDVYTVCDAQAGIKGAFEESEIIHIKNYTRDGKHGLSTLTFARTTMDIAQTGDAETLTRFANGGNVRGIVSNDTSVRGFGEYQDKELEKAATDLDDRFRSGERIVSVPGQVEFKQLSITSVDMQFLETRSFSVREICRFFNVPPAMVFEESNVNYKSAELENIAFLSNSLNPILRRIENELHRKLIPEVLCCKRKFQFDRRGLYACDLESKAKYQAQTIAAGIYTVNDWRKEENKEPIAGGDTVLISANLRKL